LGAGISLDGSIVKEELEVGKLMAIVAKVIAAKTVGSV